MKLRENVLRKVFKLFKEAFAFSLIALENIHGKCVDKTNQGRQTVGENVITHWNTDQDLSLIGQGRQLRMGHNNGFNLMFFQYLQGFNRSDRVAGVRKNKRDNATLFIDGSREFVKVTNSNKLTPENIARLLSLYEEREDAQYTAALVPNEKLAEQDHHLSVSTYVEQEDKRETIDITKLNAEIAQIVERENKLREEIDKIVAELEA